MRLAEYLKCRLNDNVHISANTVEVRPDDLTIDCCVFIKTPITHIIIDKIDFIKGGEA